MLTPIRIITCVTTIVSLHTQRSVNEACSQLPDNGGRFPEILDLFRVWKLELTVAV